MLLALALATVALCGLVVLGCAPRYWQKRVFMFRWKVWPGVMPTRPPNFTGVWREWDRDGNLIEEGSYLRGKLHGKYTGWYADGTMQVESQSRNGKSHGRFTRWWPEGHKRREGEFDNGKMTGLWRSWDPEGNLVAECIYENDKPKDGTIFMGLDEDGVALVSVYRDFVLVEEARPLPPPTPRK